MHDPVFAALTAQIAAVERVLSRERIAEIVIGSFQQLPVARRTLDLVTTTPGLLTAADPQTTPALASLLLRLHEAGARTVQPPRCAHCGRCGSCYRSHRPGGSAPLADAVSRPRAGSAVVAVRNVACSRGLVRPRTASGAGPR